MMKLRVLASSSNNAVRLLSSAAKSSAEQNHYQVLIVGGGSGGCSMAAKCVNKLGKGRVAVIEPAEKHYYQALWTFVGGGLKTLEESGRKMKDVLPAGATWIQDWAAEFNPDKNTVTTKGGKQISYDFLIVAMGIQLNYDKVKGLVEALNNYPEVCSNYSDKYVTKTFPAIQKLKQGQALFTFPNTPIKCAGAPQKIMYLADDYWRKHGVRDKIGVTYNTALPVIFGVPKYAAVLMDIVKYKNINLNVTHSLVEVRPDKREAVFEKLATPNKETVTFKYDLLHATPPMSAPDVLRKAESLVDQSGYLNLHKDTMLHVKYDNVFGIGDCTNLPTSRTAAAVAAESGILRQNMFSVMEGKKPTAKYDGYTSCPLVTGNNKCVLAEFDYGPSPLETFPVDQGKERRTMYHMKKDAMPILYWNLMLKGRWEGPWLFRRILHLGMKK